MDPKNFLFVEKYRPSTIEECILPKDVRDLFLGIKDVGVESFPNMLFVGPAGVGKTTAAIALSNQMGMTCHLINASEENGIDMLRTKIKRFATTKSLTGGMKLIILDEADHLSRAAQPALRGLIEQHSSNCRFILTCNYPNKIIDPIISRCPRIDFTIPSNEREDVCLQIFARVSEIMEAENIKSDPEVVAKTIAANYPDMRKIIGKIQQYSKSGELSTSVVSSKSDIEIFDDVIDIIREKKYTELRKWVSENDDVDVQTFFSDMYKYLWNMYDNDKLPITKQSLAMIIPIMGEQAYRANFVADTQIVLMTFLSTFMIEVEFV